MISFIIWMLCQHRLILIIVCFDLSRDMSSTTCPSSYWDAVPVCTCTSMYLYKYVPVPVCTCTSMYLYQYVPVPVRTCTSMYLYQYVPVPVRTCTLEICSDVGFSSVSSTWGTGCLHLDTTIRNWRWASNAAFTISAWHDVKQTTQLKYPLWNIHTHSQHCNIQQCPVKHYGKQEDFLMPSSKY